MIIRILALMLLLAAPCYAATGVQLEVLWGGMFDGNGNPLLGGKVYTYEAGTTTLKDTFTDRAMTVPSTNPIILDSEGRRLRFGNGIYKLIVNASDDSLIFTRDNLTYINPGGGTGSVDVADYASLNAAITAIGSTEADLLISGSTGVVNSVTVPENIRLNIVKGGSIDLNQFTVTINGAMDAVIDTIFTDLGSVAIGSEVGIIYPQWWGAVVNDGSDDLTAIQNAVAASSNVPIFLTRGRWELSAALDLGNNDILRGSDRGTTVIEYNGIGNAISSKDNDSITVSDLTLLNQATGTSAIYLEDSTNISLERLIINATAAQPWTIGGVSISNSTGLTIYDSSIKFTNNGIYAYNNSSDLHTFASTFTNLSTGAFIWNSSAVSFHGAKFQNMSTLYNGISNGTGVKIGNTTANTEGEVACYGCAFVNAANAYLDTLVGGNKILSAGGSFTGIGNNVFDGSIANTLHYTRLGTGAPDDITYIAGAAQIANATTLDKSLAVGMTLQVSGDATLYGGARISGNTEIYNGLTVSEKASFYNSLDAGSGIISNVSTPNASDDAANKSYVDASIASIANKTTFDSKVTFTAGIDVNNNQISNVPTPNALDDAVNKEYADNLTIQAIRGNYRGLIANNNASNPTYQMDIDVDEIALVNSSNVAYLARDIDLTVTITNSGGNGLDTGSEATSTWYHMWVIYNGVDTLGMFSVSATAPTLPADFTYKAYIGAVYNDSGDDFIDIYQLNKIVASERITIFTTATDATYTAKSLAAAVPSTAITISGWMHVNTGTSDFIYLASTLTGLGEQVFGYNNVGGNYSGLRIMIAIPQTVYFKVDAGDADYFNTGWEY
jgi:hypothetical protein